MMLISDENLKLILVVGIGLLILFAGVRALKRLIPLIATEPIAAQSANRALYGAALTLAFIYLIFALSNQLDVFALLLGAIGAGLTFSLQQVLLCLIGWIATTIGHFYQVGDRIQLDAVIGYVLEI